MNKFDGLINEKELNKRVQKTHITIPHDIWPQFSVEILSLNYTRSQSFSECQYKPFQILTCSFLLFAKMLSIVGIVIIAILLLLHVCRLDSMKRSYQTLAGSVHQLIKYWFFCALSFMAIQKCFNTHRRTSAHFNVSSNCRVFVVLAH